MKNLGWPGLPFASVLGRTHHTPERSGLPSLVLGAGADRLGSPLASRGTFLSGNSVHCAAAGSETNTRAHRVNGVRMALLPRCSWFASDRKSTRLNSSHLVISYAVFCLK